VLHTMLRPRLRWKGTLHSVLVALAHVGLTTGLAPTICHEDVAAYVQEVVSWGASMTKPSDRLSSCACMLDARTGFTPLHEVANSGGLRAGGVIAVLVAHYADVMEVDARGATALHLAAMRGELPAAASLVAAAVRMRYQTNLLIARDNNGMTAVDLAEDGGHFAVARYLVQLGGIRGERALGWDECAWPLADSVLLGKTGSFIAEVDKPAANRSKGSTDANCSYPPAGRERSLLHVALAVAELQASPGGLDITQAILAHGGNASRQDGSGDLPLNRAGRADRVDLVNALLAAMPSGGVDAQDARGRTALIEASRVGARNAASTLMSGGASVDVRDDSGFTALDYANREGHEDVASAIDMAVRLPPAQLSRPGTFYNSQDFVEPPPAQEEEGTNIILIVSITVGVFLGIVAIVLIACGARAFQKQRRHLHSQGEMAVMPEDAPDDIRESLRKAIERGPSKKEVRESKKRAKHPEQLIEPTISSLVPPGQIGTDSSEGESHTPTRNRRPPIVTMRVPGQQPRKGHRSLSPTVSNARAFFDADLSPGSDRVTMPREKPVNNRDSASLPPPPSPSADSQGRARIMCAAAAQAAGNGRWMCIKCDEQNRPDRETCNNCGQSRAAAQVAPTDVPSSRTQKSQLKKSQRAAASTMPEVPALPPHFREENAELTPAEKAVMLAKEVAAKSRSRWASAASFQAPPRGIAASASRSESGSSADSSPRDLMLGAKIKTPVKGRSTPASISAPSTASSAGNSGALRAAGTSRESPTAPFDTQLPASLRGTADVSSARRSAEGNQVAIERQGSTKSRQKAKPKAKSSAQQSVL